MEKLIYKINNKEYLLMDRVMTSESKSANSKLKDIGVIQQGVKELKVGGFLTSGYAVVSCLVPVDKIKEFSEID